VRSEASTERVGPEARDRRIGLRGERIAGLASELAAAQARLAKDAPPPASGSNSTPPAAQGLTGSRTENADDYTFTLDTCKRQGTDLYCWIVVRNDGQGRRLGIQDGSRLIADDGTPYEQSSRIFGRREDSFGILFMQVPSGVLVRFGLRFNGLAAKVNHLALLEVVAMDFRIEFRDVPVT
jgi:hypothetical protein